MIFRILMVDCSISA